MWVFEKWNASYTFLLLGVNSSILSLKKIISINCCRLLILYSRVLVSFPKRVKTDVFNKNAQKKDMVPLSQKKHSST